MASGTYTHGSYLIQTRAIDYAADVIKVMLIANDVAYAFSKAHDHIDDINASELNVSGYVNGFAGSGRKTLASKTITEDLVLFRNIFDAADPSAWTLGAGKTVVACVVYWHSVDDATSVPLWYGDFPDFLTNGGAFSLIFHADGIGYISM